MEIVQIIGKNAYAATARRITTCPNGPSNVRDFLEHADKVVAEAENTVEGADKNSEV